MDDILSSEQSMSSTSHKPLSVEDFSHSEDSDDVQTTTDIDNYTTLKSELNVSATTPMNLDDFIVESANIPSKASSVGPHIHSDTTVPPLRPPRPHPRAEHKLSVSQSSRTKSAALLGIGSSADTQRSPPVGRSPRATVITGPMLQVAQREAQGDAAVREELAKRTEQQRQALMTARESFLKFSPHDELLLKMYCLTWNMFGRPPPPRAELERFLPTGVFDMYVVGSEECENSIQKSLLFSSKAKWVAALREVLGDSYVEIAAETMQAIHLIVFARKELCMYINNVESERVPTGYGDILGNKGAVAVSMDVGTTSFLFVNAHFQSGEGAVARRNADYHKVCAKLRLRDYDHFLKQGAARSPAEPEVAVPARRGPAELPAGLPALSPEEARGYDERVRTPSRGPAEPGHEAPALPPRPARVPQRPRGGAAVGVPARAQGLRKHLPLEHQAFYDELYDPAQDAVSRFDCVVWMGDLNYRTQALRRVADYLLKHGMVGELLGTDELAQQMQARLAFEDFREGQITFPPTYKFDLGSNRYDSSEKARVPSWTDRILWKARDEVLLLEKYRSCAGVTTSDHRPVYAHFLVKAGRGQSPPLHTDQTCAGNTVCPTQ